MNERSKSEFMYCYASSIELARLLRRMKIFQKVREDLRDADIRSGRWSKGENLRGEDIL